MNCQPTAQDCAHCESRKMNVFCDLSPEALEIVNQNKVIQHYKKGQFIFHSGNFSKGIYCINSGIVKVEAESENGNGHILEVVQGGEFVGYRSLFAEEPYKASAIAHEDTTVCFIPKSALFEIIKKFPEVAIRMLSKVSKEFRTTQRRMCSQTDKSAYERVAEAVLFFKEKFNDQKWTRKEIAEWAGTTPETVMRTLANFESDGFIEQAGRQIKILDRKKLLEAANLSF